MPECIDAYITLLKACNERYRRLTNRVALIHYARMLLGFFDDLRTRLTQIAVGYALEILGISLASYSARSDLMSKSSCR